MEVRRMPQPHERGQPAPGERVDSHLVGCEGRSHEPRRAPRDHPIIMNLIAEIEAARRQAPTEVPTHEGKG